LLLWGHIGFGPKKRDPTHLEEIKFVYFEAKILSQKDLISQISSLKK